MPGSGIFPLILFQRLKFSAFLRLAVRAGEVGSVVVVPCLVDIADFLADTDYVANTFCSLGDFFMISSEDLAGPPHSPVPLQNSGPDIAPTRQESHRDRH